MENSKKYTIHYAKIDLGENDIQEVAVNSMQDVMDFCFNLGSMEGIVTLIAFNEEVFVTDNFDMYFEIMDKITSQVLWTDLFIQEYPSYESAYAVALMMKEISDLCYDK